MNIKNSQPPITKQDIRKLEEKTRIALPEDYKDFLLRHNGGEPEPKVFETQDGKVESRVKKFLSISDVSEDNLVEEIEGITRAGQIPGNLVPIAVDPADNRVVLSVGGPDIGKVYYWAWDEEDEDHEASYKYMRLIANSFNEFLESLH